MQVNVIAQFHLALTLLPILQKTPGSRMTFQSSELHRPINAIGKDTKVAFESLAELNTDIGPTNLYNRSKFAQILIVKALQRRKQAGQLGFKGGDKGEAPWVNATHPGAVSTDQPKQAEEAYGKLGTIGVAIARPFMTDPVSNGCRSILFASTSPAIVEEDIWGEYIIPDRKVSDPSKDTNDEKLQENLWKLTEQILTDRLGSLSYAS
jgi:WW domain-containing oxidoreductase